MNKPTSITSITRRIPEFVLFRTFSSCRPDHSQLIPVQGPRLTSEHPLFAGRDFARLCQGIAAGAAHSQAATPYSPWLAALQSTMWGLDTVRIEAEKRVRRDDAAAHGFADFVIYGAAQSAVVEVKVIAKGSVLEPKSAHLCQLAGYCAALTDVGEPPAAAYLAYVELSTPAIRLIGFRRNLSRLTRRFDQLLEVAA